MNQQRQQAYLQLIQNLLNCRSNDEIQEIFIANQNLLDAGFLETVEAAVQMCLQQGNENTANWLQGLASYLREALNRDTEIDLQSLSKEETQAYYEFLMEVLQATADSNGNPQVIYPLLAKNTDKLDGVFAEILRRWGTNTLEEAEVDQKKYVGTVIILFSIKLSEFPLGNKATNMEISIAGYQVVLTVFTRQAFPYEWAMTQNNLGFAYWNRLQGEKAENIENAIAAYTAALIVRTRQAFPYEWAQTQNNLGNAYSNRIRGEKAENIENAIAAYTVALIVTTHEAFPQDWAMTQNNLGITYFYRIRGEKAENIENAITAYTAALMARTREAFPYEWAQTTVCLGNAYSNRIRGEKAENIENAIAAYTDALTVYTCQAFPQNWAMTQYNLGAAYRDRIRGEKAENIENAIAAYTAALTVYTRQAFPQNWAATHNNLGNAYSNRIIGEKTENIEQAIACYTQALEERTRNRFPYEWATMQNNLGIAYNDRIAGKKRENLEQAIAYYNQALKEYTQNCFPYEWARTQNNLGLAYTNRIAGEKRENLEQAIAYYNQALEEHTQKRFPYEWATIQNNLGIAYTNRIAGEKGENLEQAIAYYNQALEEYTRDRFPYEWARTQNNLGFAYTNRIAGEKGENLEQAIAYYNQALKEYTCNLFPYEWARTQMNLGLAYIYRIAGEKGENLEQAIACCTQALEVMTFDAFPEDWANIQNNLGLAYIHRIGGEETENLERAIAFWQEALKVYTVEAFPQEHAETLFNLGIVYQEANNFTSAYSTFDSAIATLESLREEIVSGEETKRKQAEEWNKLYISMVEVCLELSNITTAIEYVERSKTRNLVEQILERDSKTFFPSDVVTQLETYRDEIAAGQYQIQNSKAENPQDLAKRLQELRRQRNELQNRYLPVGYGFKFDSFQPTLDKHTAIIEWYILDDKILAFIVTQKGEVTVWQSQSKDREYLGNWGTQYLQNYYSQKDQWQHNLGEELKKLASILHIDEILNQIPNHCNKLILIPHWFLHLFPLHTLPVTSQNNLDSCCILDLFPGGVSYAPSCQLLQQVQQRQRPDFQNLFAIQNPTEDLDFTDLEVEAILSYFPSHQVLPKKQATKAALSQAATQLKQANYLHFSCHGSFNFNSPQNSCLLLAESVDENKNLDLNKCLTLGNLFERTFDFSQTRLVVLSACETGLVDLKNTSDEYISLPSGFLYAGSSSVVSSLWTVSDLSTAFLMIKFIQNLKATMVDNGDFSVAVELQKAQLWLRNATTAELQTWTNDLKLSPEQVKQNYETLDWFDADEKPFQNPVYWAAFCAIGQ